MTLTITFFALCIGVPLGLGLAILRLSRFGLVRFFAAAYIDIFRCTPMLVQILLFYFGIVPELQKLIERFPFLLTFPERFGYSPIDLVRLPAVYTGVLALGMNSGAYLAEIFRGGILSIDKGQREAALSLGFGEYGVMRYVVLPQAFTNSLPAMGNEFITLIKDSSLVSGIAVSELLYRAMLVGGRKYEFFTMYMGVGILYFCMCFPLSRLLALLEKRLRKSNTPTPQNKKTRRDKPGSPATAPETPPEGN